MDRKTLLAFALIAIVLILTPWYMNLVAPLPEDDSTIGPDIVESTNSPQAYYEPEANAPESGQNSTDLLPLEVRVNSSLYTATISSRAGGSFLSFVLNGYDKFDSTKVDLIDENNLKNLVLSFVSFDGDLVSLDNNWSLVSGDKNVNARNQERRLVFQTTFRGNLIRKTFTFFPETYQIGLEISFSSPEKFVSRGQFHLDWSGGVASTEKNKKDEYTYFKGYAYLGDELLEAGAPEGSVETQRQTGETRWTAVRSKYFISALIPNSPAIGGEVSGTRLDGRPNYSTRLRQRASDSVGHTLYMGPLDYNQIEALGVGLENTMNLGWAIIRPLGQLVTWSLKKMYGIIPNYGVVVILFAIIVKILLNPLTKKQMVSTRNMQALQPQIQKLKEKYKNDPQKLNKAQMALFKEKGVNPMGGCLPLLLQMPILISFFTVFRSTIEFRGAPFFGWITDLSLPDTLLTIAGFNLNVLPFIMGATMFLQQKYMSPTGGASDGQQKFMLYGMNIFFLFLFYSFPSGLNLYYSVFNFLSIIQQKYFLPVVSSPGTRKTTKVKK